MPDYKTFTLRLTEEEHHELQRKFLEYQSDTQQVISLNNYIKLILLGKK